jgi:tetratricopeptide (TPR) repeat protein
MTKLTLFLGALSFFCGSHLSPQNLLAGQKPQGLQAGTVLPVVSAARHPEQSYVLYLPSQYTPEHRWPIVYAFDPAARGIIPVELMKDAAERCGYIVAGSNNSRSGSWKIEAEAAQAVFDDTHVRLAIDDGRVYFAGFSGGARVASAIAERCKCAAGTLLNGAGFSERAAPSHDAIFAVFSAVGSFDFNYPEMVQLNDKLEVSGFPHMFRHFEGQHEWAPATVMEEAFSWFRLIAMKQGRETRDDIFVAARLAEAVERGHSFQQSMDLYASWREYRQAAQTFDGLTDIEALKKAAASLEAEKAVREGAKREKDEFEEQQVLTQEISSGLMALHGDPATRADTRARIEEKIIALRERAAYAKHPEKSRVLRRALGGVLVEAMEVGEQSMDSKDLNGALDCFRLAVDADPDSVWALDRLAIARALGGDRKGTLEALRRAKEKTKDSAAFSGWLRNESAFLKLREDAQFRTLLEESAEHR